MATATATGGTNDVDAIRRQMAQIRRELHEDMQNVVAGAEAATNWRHYVRLYPWAALGAAAAIGFFIVPRRRSATRAARKAAQAVVEEVREAVGSGAKAVRVEPAAKVEKEKKKSGLVGALLGMVAPVAIRAVQSYAASYLENWINQQSAAGASPFGAAGPRRPGP